MANYQPTPGVGSTLEQFADAISLLTRSQINTMMPATVIAWRPPVGAPPLRTPAMVDVVSDFLYRRTINVATDVNPPFEVAIQRSTGWQAIGPYPMITSVPVAYPGTDGMRISGPIFPGASGWLYFAQRSIDDWINMGGPVDPVFDYQWHHLSDAIFVPGARFGLIAEDIDPAFHTIGSAHGGAGMKISEGLPGTQTIEVSTLGPLATIDASTAIKIGAGAVLGAARLTDKTSADVSMAAWIATAQPILVAAAALLGIPTPPIPPTDFGIITGSSAKVTIE